MLENGMVVGAAAQWDAICTAGDDIDALADEVIAEALIALNTNNSLAKAIDEALANGSIDGALLAGILIPIDMAARWKALTKLADCLIVSASSNLIYETNGTALLAARFGACAVLS